MSSPPTPSSLESPIGPSLPRPVGFVLGGGGSLGAIQVGMLQALAEHEVSPDLVVGTSVGSLNGAVVALDPRAAAYRLSNLWARVTRDDVFPGGPIAQVRTLQRSKTHLFPNTALASLIRVFLGPSTSFADLEIPFAAITTDVATGRPVPIRDGDLVAALLASAAIPGIFPTVDVAGRRMYDGGLAANVPMRQAVAMGARSLVVLDCTFPGQVPVSPDTLADVILFTVTTAMRAQAELEAPLVAESVPVVYLPGPAPQLMSPLDFGRTIALVDESYESARRFLASLVVRGPGLYGAPSA